MGMRRHMSIPTATTDEDDIDLPLQIEKLRHS
jgi:hypothetical protein